MILLLGFTPFINYHKVMFHFSFTIYGLQKEKRFYVKCRNYEYNFHKTRVFTRYDINSLLRKGYFVQILKLNIGYYKV
jgi:hypothetical protein